MKKVIALVLAALMVCCLFAGCGTNTASGDASGSAEKKSLIMATNAAFPPYEFKEGDSFAGIDVEIATAIADKLDMKLEIRDVEFGTIVAGVQTGKFDMGMAGMTVTDERKISVNFTDTYATGIQAVIVAQDSEYTSFEDFYTGYETVEGKEVPAGVKEGILIGVQQDTTGDIYCSAEPSDWGFGASNVVRYKNGADAVQALKSGKVTAVIIDNEPAKSFVAANGGLKILDGAYTEEQYAICVSKSNTELLNQINTALAELKADGTVQNIIDKYIAA